MPHLNWRLIGYLMFLDRVDNKSVNICIHCSSETWSVWLFELFNEPCQNISNAYLSQRFYLTSSVNLSFYFCYSTDIGLLCPFLIIHFIESNYALFNHFLPMVSFLNECKPCLCEIVYFCFYAASKLFMPLLSLRHEIFISSQSIFSSFSLLR